MVKDINNKRSQKFIDALDDLTTQMILTDDKNSLMQLYNSIREKLDHLRDALQRLR